MTITTAPNASLHSDVRSGSLGTREMSPEGQAYRAAQQRVYRRRLVAAATVLLFVGIGALGLFAAAISSQSSASSQIDRSFPCFIVQRGELPLTVIEQGTLESQSNVQLFCEVDDVPGDGIYGTPILWLIENGAKVQKGDLVVELDASGHIERLDQQILKVNYARAQFIARTLDYQNRQTHNKTVKANAELAVELAKLRLLRFQDEHGGTFQAQMQEIELGIEQRESGARIDQRNLAGTEYLYELGYKSKGDLAQARLEALRARGMLDREKARRRELVEYTYVRTKAVLEGALQSARRALIQVEGDNAAALAQNKVWLKMAELGKTWHEMRLDYYRQQLEKCKIYAPQSGMVAYHVESTGWGRTSTIAEGMAMRKRQPILSIPDLSRMQVKTRVHETVVDRVKKGMPATIRIEAFPGQSHKGTVESVDVLPDPGSWLNSDTKVYYVLVTVDHEIEQVKPGMTAVVEIHIDVLQDVLYVPIQSIVQHGSETWCYVVSNGRVAKRSIDVGDMNAKFAEVRAGLSAGDRVVLNPDVVHADTPAEQRVIASDQ